MEAYQVFSSMVNEDIAPSFVDDLAAMSCSVANRDIMFSVR